MLSLTNPFVARVLVPIVRESLRHNPVIHDCALAARFTHDRLLDRAHGHVERLDLMDHEQHDYEEHHDRGTLLNAIARLASLLTDLLMERDARVDQFRHERGGRHRRHDQIENADAQSALTDSMG